MENDNEEYCDAYIDCPHCDKPNHICDLIPEQENGEEMPVGGEFHVACQECKLSFILVENLVVSYDAYKTKDIYNN